MREGNYLKAIECYDKAIEGFPGHYGKRIKADAYFGAGMYEEALECYRKRLSSFEYHIDDFVVYCDIGRTLDRMNRFDEAMQAYDKALDIIENYYERSITHIKDERWMGYEAIERGCQSSLDDKNVWTSQVCNAIAWSCMLRAEYDLKNSKKHYDEAIRYIDRAIQLNYDGFNNWNVKAIILEDMGRYEQSKRFYDASIKIKRNDVVVANKARMLKNWAFKLYHEGNDLEKAIALLGEAIDDLSEIQSDEDIAEYQNLLERIRHDADIKRQCPELKTVARKNLITITGTNYYDTPEFEKGMKFQLVREPDNEHDSDAIAVYFKGEKIGYVANTDYTACNLTAKATDVDIQDTAYAKYLVLYQNQYHIAQIMR